MKVSEFFNPNGIMMNCGGRNLLGKVEHITQDEDSLHMTVKCRQDENRNPHMVTRYDMLYDGSAAFHLIPRKVIFNPPATIVYWSDGSKTVVKCCAQDEFDTEKGLAMAIVKRAFGDRFHEKFKWMMETAEGKERCDPALMNFQKLIEDAKKSINNAQRPVEWPKKIDMSELLRGDFDGDRVGDIRKEPLKTCRTCAHFDIRSKQCMCHGFSDVDKQPGIPMVGSVPNCASWKEITNDEQD